MKRNGLEQPQANPLVVPTAISGNMGEDAQQHVAPMLPGTPSAMEVLK